jgi:hypothetical protein
MVKSSLQVLLYSCKFLPCNSFMSFGEKEGGIDLFSDKCSMIPSSPSNKEIK